MAGQENYYEEPADQEYYGQEEMLPEHAGEDLTALASIPWVAIALAVHVILLVIAWFIIPAQAPSPPMRTIDAETDQIALPPPPEQPPEEQSDFPEDKPVEEKPTEDEKIVEDATDDVNEDPTEQPNEDLAENDDSRDESPHPNRDSTTSAVGLGGGIGGGGGAGGAGGFEHRRAGGPGGKPRVHEDRARAALDWLRDHQNPQGYWSATTFSADSTRTGAEKTYNIDFINQGQPDGDKGWEATTDIGLTGLALLAFVGAGYDHKEGDYRPTCRKAIVYLRKVQSNDGCFGPKEDDHFVYNHAICAMAMAETYGLSGDQVLKPIADKAVDFMLKAQNPGLGWRYGVQPGVNDSSVTGWMVLALKSCTMAGLDISPEKLKECYNGAAEWYDTVTVDAGGYYRTGYDRPGSPNARLRSSEHYDNNPSMDSIYVMSMMFMGKADARDAKVSSLARTCIETKYLPKWGREDGGQHVPDNIDYYYWYYASLALFQVGGSIWDTWEKAMSTTLLESQRGYHEKDVEAGRTDKDVLDEHGSWDPVGAWGSAGGRVYATAINALTLEVYYRYLRLQE